MPSLQDGSIRVNLKAVDSVKTEDRTLKADIWVLHTAEKDSFSKEALGKVLKAANSLILIATASTLTNPIALETRSQCSNAMAKKENATENAEKKQEVSVRGNTKENRNSGKVEKDNVQKKVLKHTNIIKEKASVKRKKELAI